MDIEQTTALLQAKIARRQANQIIQNIMQPKPPSTPSSKPDTRSNWQKERAGKARLFYSNQDAKATIAEALADVQKLEATIAGLRAQAAQKSASGLVTSSTEFSEMSVADKAEFQRLGGKVDAARKAPSAASSATPPKPAATVPSNLTGFAKVSAAFKAQERK